MLFRKLAAGMGGPQVPAPAWFLRLMSDVDALFVFRAMRMPQDLFVKAAIMLLRLARVPF